MDQMVRFFRSGQLLEAGIDGELKRNRSGGDRLGALTKHQDLLRRFRAKKALRETEFYRADAIGDVCESCRNLTRMTLRILRCDIRIPADIAAGLE